MKLLNEKEQDAIVNKVFTDAFQDFIQNIGYLIKYTNNASIKSIWEFMDDQVVEISKKLVGELTDREKVLMMVHWSYINGGIDGFRSTPFDIIKNLTDAEVVQEFNRRCNDPTSYVTIKSEAKIKWSDN